MPDLDGPALLRRLQREWPALAKRLIFITGDTVGLGIGSALDKLGRPVIEKPISPEEMRRVIQATLAESHNGYYILDRRTTFDPLFLGIAPCLKAPAGFSEPAESAVPLIGRLMLI